MQIVGKRSHGWLGLKRNIRTVKERSVIMWQAKPQGCSASAIRLSLVAIFLLVAGPIVASQSPPGCFANNLNLNIGVLASNVTNGTVVTWVVSIQNPTNVPGSCDVTLGPSGLTFTCPGPTGVPNGSVTTLIPGGTTLPPGFGPTNFSIACPINITNGALTAAGRASAPNSVVHKNPIQDDPANVDKSISIGLVYPCLVVTKQCLTATNYTGDAVVITYTGSVSNCTMFNPDAPSQNRLENVVVYNDQPTNGTVVIGAISLIAGTGTNFTRSYTNTANICGPFPDTLTAVATVLADDPFTITNSASSQCTIAYT